MTDRRLTIPRLSVPMPTYMKGLKVDRRGFAVPYFVQWFKDGKPVESRVAGSEPDFRVVDADHFAKCVLRKVCWICGSALGKHKAYVIGPMCAINRITSEPPSHRACAEYALKVCPFMLNPNMKRDFDYEEVEQGVHPPGELHDAGNPGVMVLWMSSVEPVPEEVGNTVLLRIGPPTEVVWWTKGREAAFHEAELALVDGLHKLELIARKHDQPEAMQDLRRLYNQARWHLPGKVVPGTTTERMKN